MECGPEGGTDCGLVIWLSPLTEAGVINDGTELACDINEGAELGASSSSSSSNSFSMCMIHTGWIFSPSLNLLKSIVLSSSLFLSSSLSASSGEETTLERRLGSAERASSRP